MKIIIIIIISVFLLLPFPWLMPTTLPKSTRLPIARLWVPPALIWDPPSALSVPPAVTGPGAGGGVLLQAPPREL